MLLNRDRAVALMDKCNVDVLVASLPENVLYFSGYAGWITWKQKERYTDPGCGDKFQQAYAVLPRDKTVTPCLVVPMSMAYYSAQVPGWVDLDDIWTYGQFPMERPPQARITLEEEVRFEEIRSATDRNRESAGEALVTALQRKGLDKGWVGLDMENLSSKTENMLKNRLPQVKFGNACELIMLIRMVKSAKEIEFLKKVAAVNEKGVLSFTGIIEEGRTENELLQAYRQELARQGAEIDFVGIRAGSRVTGFYPPSDYQINKGDVVFWDVGCSLNHYHADTGNAAVLGKPSEELETISKGTKAVMQTALEKVEPGIRPSEIVNAIYNARRDHGMLQIGGSLHGIGLEIREYPVNIPANQSVISDDFVKPMSADIPLEENMVINIEVPYRKLGVGGVQIELTLCVTESGFQYVSEWVPEYLGDNGLFMLGNERY